MALYEGYDDQYQEPYQEQQQFPLSGDGPWAPGYDPGPNYNGGNAPAPPAPRYDYNGGAPPDQALTPGHGWTWEGPETPSWDMSNNQWNRGVWQESEGSGLGYQTPTGGGGGAPSSGGQASSNGAVAPRGGSSGINVPSAQLPGDIASLFAKVPEQTAIQKAYQDALLNFMGRSQQTPTLDDSILGPQTEVYRAASQRGMERNRKVAAERAAASGRSQSGYLDNQINKGAQEQAFNTSSFNANLLGRELDTRRKELQSALQLAAATGDQEAERELRNRLAEVSARMQQQGLNLQGQLGAGDLDFRYDALGANTALGMEGLNQQALQMILGGM